MQNNVKPKRALVRLLDKGGFEMAEKRYARLRFDEVVHRYARSVTAVCVMRLGNMADAEDCFQNTFLKLYAKSPVFDDERHLKAWLLKVAVNECNSLLRRRVRLVPLDTLYAEPAPRTDDMRDISWALMRLQPKYREVLYLYYCERYKVREIADILGRKPNTVKTMLARGREQLRAIYGGDEDA